MAKHHGVKKHYQVLLDPNRADLVDKEAAKRGLKSTAYIRQVVYEELERVVEASVYGLAVAEDAVELRAAIKRQVEGRVKARQPKASA